MRKSHIYTTSKNSLRTNYSRVSTHRCFSEEIQQNIHAIGCMKNKIILLNQEQLYTESKIMTELFKEYEKNTNSFHFSYSFLKKDQIFI